MHDQALLLLSAAAEAATSGHNEAPVVSAVHLLYVGICIVVALGGVAWSIFRLGTHLGTAKTEITTELREMRTRAIEHEQRDEVRFEKHENRFDKHEARFEKQDERQNKQSEQIAALAAAGSHGTH